MDQLIICASLCILAIGTYAIWPSRWNVPAHMQLGFCLIGYVIPIYLAHVLTLWSPELVRYYSIILLVGASGYLAGLFIGQVGHPLARISIPLSFVALNQKRFEGYISRRSRAIALVGLAGLWICFALMGFIPAFAAQPFMAKFFRGPYAAPYQHVEILYRLSYYFLVTIVPILCALSLKTRKMTWAVLTGVSVVTIAITLTRGPIASGILLVAGIVAARKRRLTVIYIVLIAVAFPIGAIFYKLFGLMHYYRADLWQSIAAGSPDVADQLNFLYHFLPRGEFTFGRTFLGGLIPGHYKWNPAVYSLEVVTSGTSVNKIASGGLRLPAPLWGYTAFGWLGTIVVPFVSGLIQARFVRFARLYGAQQPFVQATVVYLLYMTIGVALANYYVIAIYALPPVVVCLCIAYLVAPRSSERQVYQAIPASGVGTVK